MPRKSRSATSFPIVPTMAIEHLLTRLIVSTWPLQYGLGDLKRRLADCPDGLGLTTRKLRGFPLRLQFLPHSFVGWCLYYRGIYEEASIKLLCHLLRRGMTFVDIGANYGLYTVIAAWKIGPNGLCVSVEPQPDLAEIIRNNITINGLTRVAVRQCAIGHAKTTMRLFYPTANADDGSATLKLGINELSYGPHIQVPVERLSDILHEEGISSIDAIKIDTEGAELQILQSIQELFDRQCPEFVFVECVDKHLRRFNNSQEDLLCFLWDNGYKTAAFRQGRWRSFISVGEYRERCKSKPDVVAVHPMSNAWRSAIDIFAH